jgi:hypothetical protein
MFAADAGFAQRTSCEKRSAASNETAIGVVFTNPEPDVVIRKPHGEGTVLERHSRWQDFLPGVFGQLLEVQGRIARVRFQQRELLIRSLADIGRQRPILFPEVRIGAVHAGPTLKRLGSSGFMIGNGAFDALIETPCFNIGFELNVNRLRIVFVKPLAQFFPLLWRQRINCAFDILHCV